MQTTSPFSKEISLGARGWGLGARGRRASKPHAEVRTVSGIKNVLTALAVAIKAKILGDCKGVGYP